MNLKLSLTSLKTLEVFLFTTRAYVVAQFYPWFNFYIRFFCKVMYDNEYKTKEYKT